MTKHDLDLLKTDNIKPFSIINVYNNGTLNRRFMFIMYKYGTVSIAYESVICPYTKERWNKRQHISDSLGYSEYGERGDTFEIDNNSESIRQYVFDYIKNNKALRKEGLSYNEIIINYCFSVMVGISINKYDYRVVISSIFSNKKIDHDDSILEQFARYINFKDLLYL